MENLRNPHLRLFLSRVRLYQPSSAATSPRLLLSSFRLNQPTRVYQPTLLDQPQQLRRALLKTFLKMRAVLKTLLSM